MSAGANRSGNIDWSVADEESLTAEAGAKALAHARDIATQMAKGLGAKIGNLMYASNEVEALRPLDRFRGGLSVMSAEAGTTRQTLNLNAPVITRSATISAIFAIE